MSHTLTLQNGTVLNLDDWFAESLRSALIVDPWSDQHQWELFGYGRGVNIPGTNVQSTRAHTNIPRNGDTGLPKDWEMYVTGWRARTNTALEQVVLDWAAETVVEFEYNAKIHRSDALVDLLLGNPGISRPIHMRENLSYRVFVRCENDKALGTLRTHLRGNSLMTTNVKESIADLEVLANLQPDGQLRSALRRVQDKLNPGRALTVWTHLEGHVKKVCL